MTKPTACSRAMTLGPFLTLLVLMTSRRWSETGAAIRNQPADSDSETTGGFEREPTSEGKRARSRVMTLGPFMTLMLNSQRRKSGNAGCHTRAARGEAILCRFRHASP
jgi:hypothetical protein